MSNGGVNAQRGFIFQSVIAMIECLERDDWNRVKIEPESENDKVDIMLYKDDEILSAEQIKSSQFAFCYYDVKEWLEKLKKDVPLASKYCLYLVGDKFTDGCRDFLREHNEEIKVVSSKHLTDICTGKLARYVKKKGLGREITVNDLELIDNSLFSKIFRNSISKEPLSRTAFEVAFQRALPSKSKYGKDTSSGFGQNTVDNASESEKSTNDFSITPINLFANNSVDKPTVFISYNNKLKLYVDELELALQKKAKVIRYTHVDSSGIKTWTSFREFMRTIRQQDFSVLIISKDFLESDYCIYEVMQLWKDKELWDEKVMYIVTEDANIYDSIGRLQYVKYWQYRCDKYIQEASELKIVNAGDSPSQAKQYQMFAANIGQFLDKVADSRNPKKDEAAEEILKRIDDFKKKSSSQVHEDYKNNTICTELISACKQLQDGYQNRQLYEYEYTILIRNILRNNGILANENALYGHSLSGRHPGEVDLLIMKNTTEVQTVVETIRLKKGGFHYLYDKLYKLLYCYNPSGLSELFFLVYVQIAKYAFNTMWEKYLNYINNKNIGPFYVDSIIENNTEYPFIKHAMSLYKCDSLHYIVHTIFVWTTEIDH